MGSAEGSVRGCERIRERLHGARQKSAGEAVNDQRYPGAWKKRSESRQCVLALARPDFVSAFGLEDRRKSSEYSKVRADRSPAYFELGFFRWCGSAVRAWSQAFVSG